MRTVAETDSVRLYHLDDGAAVTLFYGSLAQALAVATDQPEAVQEALFLQTSSDVVEYLDLLER